MAIWDTTNVEIVKFLVFKGADVNVKDNLGFSPLHEATKRGKIGIVEFLVSSGSNISLKDNDGRIPLDQ